MFGGNLERYKREYDEGDVVFYQGDVGDSLFVVQDGEVVILSESGENEREITTLSNGQIVGEMGLRSGTHKRTATVRAKTEVTGWKIPHDKYKTVIDKHKKFRHKLISTLINRLDSTTSRLEEVMEQEKYVLRLSYLVLPYLSSQEWEDDEVEKTLEIEHSKEFLAYNFGATVDIIEDYLSLLADRSLDEFELDAREKVFKIARRIVEEGIDRISAEYSGPDSSDSDLVRATRKARGYLDDLEDEDEDLDRSDVQDIMSDRKPLKKLLKQKKETRDDNFIIDLFDRILGGIDREINRAMNE